MFLESKEINGSTMTKSALKAKMVFRHQASQKKGRQKNNC